MVCEEVVFTNEVILPVALLETLLNPASTTPKITKREVKAITDMWSMNKFALQDFAVYVQLNANAAPEKFMVAYQNTVNVDGTDTEVVSMMFPVDSEHFAEVNFFKENGALQIGKSVNDLYNSWLDVLSESQIQRIEFGVLSVFNYIQCKMMCEMKEIKHAKTQVSELKRTNNANGIQQCVPVRVADFQYRYVYEPHDSTRKYTRHTDA